MPGQDLVAHALRDAARALADISITARADAEHLMALALGVSRSDLLLRHMETPAPDTFRDLVARRLAHEPMGYILGEEHFCGLTFKVGPQVLIPRPDSEVLVELALSRCPSARTVLDCGTGSGALLLSVLSQLPAARGIGIERSQAALAIASANMRALGLADRAAMVQADWDIPGWAEPLGGPFDLVLANPPYVESGALLEPSVLDFEPAEALFSGPDGLDAYRSLVPQLAALLAPGGLALVEIGADQGPAITALARDAGLVVEIHRDHANRDRVARIWGIN